jgi:hypothetical protein
VAVIIAVFILQQAEVSAFAQTSASTWLALVARAGGCSNDLAATRKPPGGAIFAPRKRVEIFQQLSQNQFLRV